MLTATPATTTRTIAPVLAHDVPTPDAPSRAPHATADAGGRFLIATDGFARGMTTGVIVKVVQTGRAVRNGQVRVRIIPARDAGDMAGTLTFDWSDGFGGVAHVTALAAL